MNWLAETQNIDKKWKRGVAHTIEAGMGAW